MAMDVFERLNRRFGNWYEGLFGGSESRDLRPRDVLRRILSAMEDARREGLDGNIYVPNLYTLRVSVHNQEERDYLRTFLSAEELAAAVMQVIEQHGYRLRGGLVFTVEEVPSESAATILRGERVGILCRFDPNATVGETDPNAGTILVGPGTSAPAVAVAPMPNTHPRSTTEAPAATKRNTPTLEPATIPAAPLAMLAVYSPEGDAREVFPLTARGAQIGRGLQAGNDIVLDDGMVSKKHARISYENGQFFLHDEKSTNGTYIGEEQLTSGATVPVRSGDMLRIGMTYIRFALTPPNTLPPPDPTLPAPPRQMSATPPPEWKNGETRFDWEGRDEFRASVGANAFRLVAENGEIHPLASEMTVGRALTGDITLIGNGVATQHARLTIQGGNLYVEDLNTTGGTTVNGERIPAHFKVALYDTDTIAFGDVGLRVQRFTVGKNS